MRRAILLMICVVSLAGILPGETEGFLYSHYIDCHLPGDFGTSWKMSNQHKGL